MYGDGIHGSVEMLFPSKDSSINYDNQKEFGIFKLNIDDHDPIVESISWIITIDRSGSMASICEDGNSKMDHIKHTLKNMLNYFNQFKNIFQKVTFIMFDHEAEIVLRHAVVNDELISNFENIQFSIFPRGETDIENALKNVNKNISIHEKTIHIFMSDGKITRGSDKIECLKSNLNTKNCINVFIGYGCDHDAQLMQTISKYPMVITILLKVWKMPALLW